MRNFDSFNIEDLYKKIPRAIRTASLRLAGPRSSRPHYGHAEYKSRGKLPHLLINNGIYFITWRLADALPLTVIEQLSVDQRNSLTDANLSLRGMTRKDKQKIHARNAKLTEKVLDKGYGSCYLNNPDCAEIMANALSYFDNERYRLLAWCVMPNHVHTVVKPFEGHTLSKILHSWKSFSAKEINKVVGRKGKVWQDEYYDRLIRDEEHLERALFYVVENPVKAGLEKWKWVWVSG